MLCRTFERDSSLDLVDISIEVNRGKRVPSSIKQRTEIYRIIGNKICKTGLKLTKSVLLFSPWTMK